MAKFIARTIIVNDTSGDLVAVVQHMIDLDTEVIDGAFCGAITYRGVIVAKCMFQSIGNIVTP